MTRVLVTGDRGWGCVDLAVRVVRRLAEKYGPGLVVVHGDCPTGVDVAFRKACEQLDVHHEPHPADWDSLGKRAGPIRNQAMVDLGADFCIAFHRCIGRSKGTKDAALRCLEADIPVWLVAHDKADPVRIRSADDIYRTAKS